MVERFFTILFLIMLLLCVIGAVYFFYRAIRLFIIRKIRRGVVYLILSLLLGFIVFFVISAVIGAREYSRRCLCGNNLKQITLFVKMYASDHQEMYSSTLNGLTGDYLKTGDRASSTVPPLPKSPPCIPTSLPTVECPYCQHPILVAMVKKGENTCPKCRKTYIAEW